MPIYTMSSENILRNSSIIEVSLLVYPFWKFEEAAIDFRADYVTGEEGEENVQQPSNN